MTGRTLSHYRVGDEISRGGMGVVYRASDLRLNRDVALKVLPEELMHDATRKQRFVQEAQAASALEHPHIAVVHEIDEADGVSFIAMELIRGEKLSELLARQRLTPAGVLELASEIASGLACAHDRGIVHRDLKPANVMITEPGHAKIIDFGIAKLVESAPVDAMAETIAQQQTGEGVVVGTAAYMSPEQARSERVDHRSDIFAFGVLLHEMLSGRAPFHGRSALETASAILHQPAPRLGALGHDVSPQTAAELQRIVDKCLAKDPADRYQGMKDVGVDLRATRRALESTTYAAAGGRRRRRSRSRRAPAAALIVVAVALTALLTRDRTEPTPVPDPASAKPSVAVLHFENTTGSADLDWLRTGITEMVVTDLSQSQELVVVATDRLYDAVRQERRSDDRVLTPDAIRAVADRIGVAHVIVGSFQKAGEAIRINVRLQDAQTGRIVASERVEGSGESSLFAMVDDLSRRLHTRFVALRAGVAPELLRGPASAPDASDRGLESVTTASIEAFRYYAEGTDLHERNREADAAVLFEKATTVDPGFAMAYAKLAVTLHNLGRFAERDRYAAMALNQTDRLTPRERYYIEGFYYLNRRGGTSRAIDAFRNCLVVAEHHYPCRHNLALAYSLAEQHAEAAAAFEELIRRGSPTVTVYSNLAYAYRRLGQFDRVQATVDTFLRRHPEDTGAHAQAGDAHLTAGRFGEAMAAFERAARLNPSDASGESGRVVAHVLQGQWTEAERVASAMSGSGPSARRWMGAAYGAVVNLHQGRSAAALAHLDHAIAGVPEVRLATAHTFAAEIRLARGEAAAALRHAEQAVAAARESSGEGVALALLAVVQATLGRRADAEATLARATDADAGFDSALVPREAALARGQMALALGDHAVAVDQLARAAAMLSPRGAYVRVPNPHVPTWHALGRAYLAVGRDEDAVRWLQRVCDSGYERVSGPFEYGRSWYLLGQAHEKLGDAARALQAYRRFVELFENGDLDRRWVADAQAKLRAAG